MVSLISWALVLTILISYAGNYFTSAGHQAATVELYYSDMLDMAENGQLAEVAFDPNESILHLTPAEGYTYTGKDGLLYTKTADGWTYSDSNGKTHEAVLDPIVVELANEELVQYLHSHGAAAHSTRRTKWRKLGFYDLCLVRLDYNIKKADRKSANSLTNILLTLTIFKISSKHFTFTFNL